MGSREYLSRNLFGGEPPQRGEEGYLELGFSFDKEGQIVDAEGNVHSEEYGLVKEAPSEGLRIARKQHPTWSDQDLAPLARIYRKQLEARENKENKEP